MVVLTLGNGRVFRLPDSRLVEVNGLSRRIRVASLQPGDWIKLNHRWVEVKKRETNQLP